MKNKLSAACWLGFMMASVPGLLLAADQTASSPSTQPATSASAQAQTTQPGDTRYGLFNWLDRRSAYDSAFPEPFLVDDTAFEDNEGRLDWLHTANNADHSDSIKTEIEKGFGVTTFEIEAPYTREVSGGQVTKGWENVDLGVRAPFYQYVSASGAVDSTFGAALEVGIPTGSDLSKNTELVPKLFNDLKIANFTLQSLVGYSTLFGPGEGGGGLQNFEYGFVFGYTIQHEQLPLPGVLQFIPMFELTGETGLNKDSAGDTSLTGNAAFRVNLKPIGRVQPRLGTGFVFPIDTNARQDLHWGVITSLVFEY
jgi:hypothetical protein